MGLLSYRPGWEEARQRLTAWWNGEDIGRPAMQITVPRAEPYESIEAMPEPEGWVTDYSASNPPYRVNLALREFVSTDFFGEGVPAPGSGNLAPGCLALFLGCRGVEMPGTVWLKQCIDSPENARFEYDPDNFYWKLCLDIYRQVGERCRGKFLQSIPDLIEGLDTLASLRGTEKLLQDLIERPGWVHRSLREITDRYFHCYDILYDMLRDEVGGSCFWAWAPGRMAKFQCDFSAMISPAMFREFMVPVLAEMTERVSHCMYHWDGPGAIRHHDALLSIPRLNMLQWTPGAGNEPSSHKRWWPLYHKTLDAGKKLHIGAEDKQSLLALRREFGEKMKMMLVGMSLNSPQEAEECLRAVEF